MDSVPNFKGLKNLKNTCFINSVLQCLGKITQIRNFMHIEITEILGKNEIMNLSDLQNSHKLLYEFKSLIDSFYTEEKVIRPTAIVSCAYDLFKNYNSHTQEDAQEFLYLLLDKLDTQLREVLKVDSTVLSQIFSGRKISTLSCSYCKATKNNEEEFWQLELPIPSSNERSGDFSQMTDEANLINQIERSCMFKLGNLFKSLRSISLYDCIDLNFSAQKIGNCNSCGNSNVCEIKEVLSKLPSYLILALKRFKYTTKPVKINDRVYIPKTLKLNKFTSEQDSDYDLVSIIQHRGGVRSGHYNTFIFADSGWYYLSDDTIYPSTWEQVLRSQVYICIYSRI
jgi:ubiquitin carboxyl-terminal hydrolase 44/49